LPNYNRIGLKRCRFYPQNFHPREGLIGLDKWPESEKNDIDRDKVVFKKLGGLRMKIQEIREKAKALGLKITFGLSKTELIRRVQKAEGNFDCFGTAKDYCDQFQCCFRDDCFRFVKD
jgi:hypothetical protein